MRKRAVVRKSDGSAKYFQGSVVSVKGDFAFVRCAELSSDVYLNRADIKQIDWANLRAGDVLRFKVGFSFRGPACMDAAPL